jgi:hypothetical protein
MFRDLRGIGEWFRAAPELVAYVENVLKTNVRTPCDEDSNAQGLTI